jgi:hypothetical protein
LIHSLRPQSRPVLGFLLFLLEAVSQVSEGDEGTGDVEEALVNEDIAILSHQEAAEVLEPSEGALDFPSFT